MRRFFSRPAKSLMWLATPLCLMLFYNNCAQQQEIAVDDMDSLMTDGVFETRIGGTSSKPLDIVWVIDNSGSMDAEAAHVRNNFNQFINSVKSAADIRVALISKSGTTGTAVSLPVTGSAYLQINQTVGSTDGLSLTAAALCPASGGGAACSDGRLKTGAIRGALRGFLRADTHKVFVFVTDDNSTNYSRTDFMKVFTEVYPTDSAIVYGFVGANAAASPCIARVGSVYVDLANNTGGSVYNICDTDWTSTFSTLATSVINLASGSARIPAVVYQAQHRLVYVDGVEVPANRYTLDGSGIHIDDVILAGRTAYTLRIVYWNDPPDPATAPGS